MLKTFVTALNLSASVPTRRVRLEFMRIDKGVFSHDVDTMLARQHVCVTTDDWTSCANDTILSPTVAYITDWKLIAHILDCETMEGSTTGDDLAKMVKGKVERHGLRGRVAACTTDCEPSTAKAGRTLMERDAFVHIRCTNRRLELVSSIAFDRPDVKKTMILVRALVARFTKSSQMADHLRSCLERQTCHRPS